MRLTDSTIGTIAAPEKGWRLVFDQHRDAPRGFALRVTAAGGRAFVLRYTVDGRQRLKTVGDWPTWTVDAARAEARTLAQGIAQGVDPLEVRRRRKEAPTVAAFAAEWADRDLSGLKSGPAMRKLVEADFFPAVKHVKLSDLTRQDVLRAVEAKAKVAPRQAALLLVYIRRLLEDAANRGLIAVNPAAGLKPGAVKVPGKRNPLAPRMRGRVLNHDEIRGLWNGAEASEMHGLTAICIKMILLTGQRPGEVCGMHRDEIDGRMWTIPAARRGKTGTPHVIYLTDTALDLIGAARAEQERLQRRRGRPWSGFVFEMGTGEALRAAGLAKAVLRHGGALGAKDIDPWGRWTPHDLRRTMRTGLSACHVRPDIAEMVVGHTRKGIIAVYDLHGFEADRRAALEAWEVRLAHIVAGRDPDAPGDNVIKMGVRA
jgi:integrase